ncbi:MAG TPA: signal recognition particle-docking protein FtsY [Halomonas sp.]|nr:signal recognition particle-docking protein FtsY [Halomonas sp.]
MFDFFKRKKRKDEASAQEVPEQDLIEQEVPQERAPAAEEAPPASAPIDESSEPVETAEQVAPAVAPADAETAEPEPLFESAEAGVPEVAASARQENVGGEKPRGEKRGWFRRMREGLGKTRANLSDGVANLFLGRKQIDDELMEDLETQLLLADVGIEATTGIIDRLSERVSRKELNDPEALYRALQNELAALLEGVTQPLALPPKGEGPFVILVIGVNGVGKTTTIGKLTQRFQREGRSVMLAAGDTFRAAAVEQLKVWGERNDVPVVAQHTGADSASVVYDALAAARARGVDVLIADTAGRLHNKAHLMEELKKVHRVMGKLDAKAPHEVMLVLDAGTGQNAISQATTFHEAVPISGITLTKLDGTAKGGIIFALAQQLEIPIRFIGVGESLDDLRPFAAHEFVDALFARDDGGA